MQSYCVINEFIMFHFLSNINNAYNFAINKIIINIIIF